MRAAPSALLATAVAMAWLTVEPARAAIVTTASTRAVHTEATGGPAEGALTFATGPYADSATTFGGNVGGIVTAFADQSSSAPTPSGPTMSGRGSVLATANWNDAPPFPGYSALANSFFDVFFEVDVTGFYDLSGEVGGSRSGAPFSGFAAVRIREETAPGSGTFLPILGADFDRNLSSPGTTPFATTVFLSTGVAYELRADAVASGGGDTPGEFFGTATFNFLLSSPASVATPEPSSFTLIIGLGISFTVALRRRRGRPPLAS
jgi:hypothetical protein